MIIREARPEDCEAVLPLATALATSFVVEPAAFRVSFKEIVSSDSSLVLVAEFDSAAVGYLLGFDHVAFFANGRVATVEEIFVEPARRGTGMGKALMRKFEEWAESRDSAQVVVATRRASAFYLALGYEDTATCFKTVLKEKAQP
jgi:GNAT superfamily N-acetyltransferase